MPCVSGRLDGFLLISVTSYLSRKPVSIGGTENSALYGSVNKPPSAIRGRPRLIARAVLTSIHLLLKDNPDIYLDELVWWLGCHHGIDISVSQLHANLKLCGLGDEERT